MASFGKTHFGASAGNNLRWTTELRRRTERLKCWRQISYCAFKHGASCPFRIRLTDHDDADELGRRYELEIGNWDHSDHSTSTLKRGLAPHIQQIIDSPSMKNRPQQTVALLSKRGIPVDHKLRDQATTYIHRKKAKKARGGLKSAEARTWGGFNQLLLACRCNFNFYSSPRLNLTSSCF